MAENRKPEMLETLKCAQDILGAVINTCMDCRINGTSWNKACLKYGLDPVKTKDLVLGINKCTTKPVSLKLQTVPDMYDGYECFYRDVFGYDIFKSELPPDYKNTVKHVLYETDIPEDEAHVTVLRYGLASDRFMLSYKQAADLAGVKDQERARKMIVKCIRKCRDKERIEKLRLGLEKYVNI